MADEKKFTTEQLADDKLDNIAGGTVDEAQMRKLKEAREEAADRTVRTEYKPLVDEHDINLA